MRNPISRLWWLQAKTRTLRKVLGTTDAIRLAFAHKMSGEIAVTLRPSGRRVVLRCQSTDRQCLEKVFIAEEYRNPFQCDPELIIDAGANIGMATLYFAQEYPKAQIVAIEPEQSNFEQLRKNCAGLPNVTLLNAALWPTKRHLSIVNQDAEKWAFTVTESEEGSAESASDVEAVTVPEVLRRMDADHVDILKLDIESAEREVFAENSDLWLPCVRQIIIELHDRFRNGCARAFYNALSSFDYSQEIQGENIFVQLGTEPLRVPTPAAEAPSQNHWRLAVMRFF